MTKSTIHFGMHIDNIIAYYKCSMNQYCESCKYYEYEHLLFGSVGSREIYVKGRGLI